MKKTAVQRGLFLLLACALMWGALAWPRAPLDAGTVVTEDLEVLSGRENWLRFYHASQAGRPASVHLTRRFLADERLLRPEDVIYEQELVYDGEAYTLRETGGGAFFEDTYRCLLYFPEVPSPSPASHFVSSTHYVLADDETLTWDDIWRSMISSHTKDIVHNCNIYSEYTWRA